MTDNVAPIHVFMDNSNVWLGAAGCRAEKEPMVPSQLFRIHFGNLFKLAENGRRALTKEVAGSLPPECEPLWQYAEKHGYNTNLLFRVNDGGRIREQSVDEALHLKIANTLLDYNAPQTLVLMTGDGAESELGTSFIGQAERALKRGWQVELWSWKLSRSKKYLDLAKKDNNLMILDLDDYYEKITFIQEGYRYVGTVKEDVSARIVARLK